MRSCSSPRPGGTTAQCPASHSSGEHCGIAAQRSDPPAARKTGSEASPLTRLIPASTGADTHYSLDSARPPHAGGAERVLRQLRQNTLASPRSRRFETQQPIDCRPRSQGRMGPAGLIFRPEIPSGDNDRSATTAVVAVPIALFALLALAVMFAAGACARPDELVEIGVRHERRSRLARDSRTTQGGGGETNHQSEPTAKCFHVCPFGGC